MIIESARLHLLDPAINADRIYEIAWVESPRGAFHVHFGHGRRGATLNFGSKFETAVSAETSEMEYNAVLREKLGKGYRTIGTDVDSVLASHARVCANVFVSQEKKRKPWMLREAMQDPEACADILCRTTVVNDALIDRVILLPSASARVVAVRPDLVETQPRLAILATGIGVKSPISELPEQERTR